MSDQQPIAEPAFRVDPAYATFPGPLISADAIEVGMTLVYPCQVGGRTEHLEHTVVSIVEYPVNRVLYFDGPGAVGLIDRRAVAKVAAA